MIETKVTTLTNSDIIEMYLFWYVTSECKVKIMPLETVCTPIQSVFSQACLNTEKSSKLGCNTDLWPVLLSFSEKCEICFKYAER